MIITAIYIKKKKKKREEQISERDNSEFIDH